MRQERIYSKQQRQNLKWKPLRNTLETGWSSMLLVHKMWKREVRRVGEMN